MEVVDREQFAELWNNYMIGLGDYDSPLWIPEEGLTKSQWFVKVKPIGSRPDYYDWCAANCQGRVLCYSSNDDFDEEWYGFTNKDDIVWWILKWG